MDRMDTHPAGMARAMQLGISTDEGRAHGGAPRAYRLRYVARS